MSDTMDADLSKFIDLVQAKQVVHSAWEGRLADECDRLQFEYERADAAGKRLGQKWKERGKEIERLRAALAKARIHVFATNEAEHLMDGFGPRSRQPSDATLKEIDDALTHEQSHDG